MRETLVNSVLALQHWVAMHDINPNSITITITTRSDAEAHHLTSAVNSELRVNDAWLVPAPHPAPSGSFTLCGTQFAIRSATARPR